MNITERKIKMLALEDGTCPFEEWLGGIKDLKTSATIDTRLARVEAGALGDHENVGSGVWELKIDLGPGYRIYYAEHEQVISVAGRRRQKESAGRHYEVWRLVGEIQK